MTARWYAAWLLFASYAVIIAMYCMWLPFTYFGWIPAPKGITALISKPFHSVSAIEAEELALSCEDVLSPIPFDHSISCEDISAGNCNSSLAGVGGYKTQCENSTFNPLSVTKGEMV